MTSLALSDLFSVRDKVVVVTGGSRGIGEMIAAGFLANGARVYITSRKKEACDATAARLTQEYGGACVSLPANLAEIEEIETFAAALSAHERHLDVLVNNAAVSWGAPIEDFPEHGWDKVMDTNVKGVFFLTQRLLPLLERNATPEDPSRVINVGSIDGIQTPRFDTFSYGPSKAAVHALTRQFPTKMLSSGIGAGADPDWDAFGADFPRGRIGSAADIAGLSIMLASRAGAFTVGDVITCDGGSLVC